MSTSQDRGAAGEAAAERFLRRLGYRILERNYSMRGGEIDLIALDRGTIVFVEVKTRSRSDFGSPFEAVGAAKQRRIETAAAHYRVKRRLYGRNFRYDIVAVWWEESGLRCELIRNAFEARRWA